MPTPSNFSMLGVGMGNMITYGYTDGWNPLKFRWEKGRQLAEYTAPDVDRNVKFKYDHNGLRTQKTITNTYTSSSTVYDFTYVGNLLVRQTDNLNRTLDFAYDASGTMIGVKYNGVNYYYMRNLQGDVIGIYDSDGDIVCRYSYSAWGLSNDPKDANGNTIPSYSHPNHIANLNPIRYRGYYYDAEAIMYYCQSRYYSPQFYRFLNADALFIAGDALLGSNMYVYCLNNPVKYL